MKLHLKKPPRQAKLQTKLFQANLALVSLVLFSCTVFFYLYGSGQLTKSQLSSMSALNSSFQNQVDAAIQNLDTVSVNINYSSMSKNMLDQSFNLDISDETLNSSIVNDMADLFIALSGTELKADQINLYDFSGNILEAGLTTLVRKSDTGEIAALVESHDRYIQEAQELEGGKVLSLPYETRIYAKSSGGSQWFLSLYRTFNNQYNRPVGVIESVKRCKSVFKSIISYEKKNKNSSVQVCVFDDSGNLVYPYDTEGLTVSAAELKAYYTVCESYDDGSAFSRKMDGEEFYIAKNVSSYSGYTYLTIYPSAEVLEPVNRLLKILVAVAAAVLAVSIFLSYRLARSVVRPVKHLKHIIQRMELDKLGQEKTEGYPVSVNELEELYQAFQMMSDKLKASMNQLMEAQEQEIRSRTLALQSQINPHFYYNSLSGIIVLAENGDTDTLVKMCRYLSRIMRYITDSGQTTVTLGDEIDYVRKYLYCVKVRYQSSLEYIIDVDADLLSIPIPKLIIQPLVENAVKYGTDCEPPWTITIRGTHRENEWQIDVIDSGRGFSAQALAALDEKLKNAVTADGIPDMAAGGMGILNVYLRWRIFCKEKILFQYGNTPEGHGIVSIGGYREF